MSAYMVGKKDIDVIVATAFYGPSGTARSWHPPNFHGYTLKREQLDELGDALFKENLSSIHYRYPDTLTTPDDTPGPIAQYWLEPYKFEQPKRKLTAVESLKAVKCFEYQSCEHPEWEQTEAYGFCESLLHHLINVLPGYDQAPWGDWEMVGA